MTDAFLSPDEMPMFDIMVTAVKVESSCGKAIRTTQESRRVQLIPVGQRRCLLYAFTEKGLYLGFRQTLTATECIMSSALDYTNTFSHVRCSRPEAFDSNTMQNDTLMETAGTVAE